MFPWHSSPLQDRSYDLRALAILHTIQLLQALYSLQAISLQPLRTITLQLLQAQPCHQRCQFLHQTLVLGIGCPASCGCQPGMQPAGPPAVPKKPKVELPKEEIMEAIGLLKIVAIINVRKFSQKHMLKAFSSLLILFF